MIKFTATKAEIEIISEIARRAVGMTAGTDIDYPMQDIMMDIEACHCNGCPLKLEELADAPNADFSHDVFGIRFHLNRKTGGLENWFLPRYAQPESNHKENHHG